jgi:uncharacterized protein YbjT (DUF2867 family)
MLSTMTTLITGGTATLGAAIVRRLRDADQPVRVLSRQPKSAESPLDWAVGDLATGVGLDAALDGATAVIHCASSRGRPAGADVAAIHQLLAACRAGTPHLVYISIVGVDEIPLPYYREKLAVEQVIERSDIPHTILRTTQFHELIAWLLDAASKLPVVPMPARTSFQPIDVREVAAHLVELAEAMPIGRAPDLGGPQIRDGADLASVYLRRHGRNRRVVPVWVPGAIGRGLRAGHNLASEHPGGGRTWEEFLTS